MKPGSVIGGRYRLIRQVGEGAMAMIWEAEHQTLGRSVAVKFLHTVGPPQSDASQRFVREARVAAAIKHRNVVDIIDFGLTDGDHRPYMVMELLEGQTLNDYLADRGRLSVPDAARIVTDVLRGLAAVHDAGIVHRDLKPDNIFLVTDEDGPFPKLLDFGLSRRVGRGDMTAEGLILGTPDYMSPEQAQGQRHIDARTDIYSMGVIFYELVTGQMPFDGGSLAELLTNVVDGRYRPITDHLPDAPGLLVDIISRAMDKDRAGRYGNAREMRAALATANLAPFQHGESGLMAVDSGRVSPSLPEARSTSQQGKNPPSGVFRDAGAKPQRATLIAPVEDFLSEPAPLPGEATRMDDLSAEATRATGSPAYFDDPTARPMKLPPGFEPTVRAMPSVTSAPEPPAPEPTPRPLPRAEVPRESPPRGDATGRRKDESAGVFTTHAVEAPKPRGYGLLIGIVVVLLASVAGGVVVYALQGGALPFAIPGITPESAPDAGAFLPIEGAVADAAGALDPDAGTDAVDAGTPDAGLTDAGLEDAGLADAGIVDDAGSTEDAGTVEEEPTRRPARGRPRRRPRRPVRR